MDLFVFGVALQLDDLHAIAKRFGNRIEHVRGGDEHHLGEIERHIEIIVAESCVLLRVKSFEQRGRWIAAEVAPELIDFI